MKTTIPSWPADRLCAKNCTLPWWLSQHNRLFLGRAEPCLARRVALSDVLVVEDQSSADMGRKPSLGQGHGIFIFPRTLAGCWVDMPLCYFIRMDDLNCPRTVFEKPRLLVGEKLGIGRPIPMAIGRRVVPRTLSPKR